MYTGIVMVGPKAGQRTECNAKDPDQCRYHKKGSHAELTQYEVDRFNEEAAEKLASIRRLSAGSRTDPEPAVNVPPVVAELAEELDDTSAEASQGGRADAIDYDDAMRAVTSFRGTYPGATELERLQIANESTVKQATATLTVNHPEWLVDPEVGPLAAMPGDTVEFSKPDGSMETIVLQAGAGDGELVAPDGAVLISDGEVVAGRRFSRIVEPAGFVEHTGGVPPFQTMGYAENCTAGTELGIKQGGSAGVVMLDGEGGVIIEQTGEVHRIIDLQGLKILGDRRPATYEDRKAHMLACMKSLAMRDEAAETARENEKTKNEWENRSAMQRLVDSAKGRQLNLKRAPAVYSGEKETGLFESFKNKRPMLAAKTGLTVTDGVASLA